MTLSIYSILAFFTAMFVLAATPGPAFFAIIARSMRSGSRAGAGVVTGVVIADLIYFSLAFLGMATLFAKFGGAFEYIRILAGAYLVFLGIKMWRAKPVQPIQGNVANEVVPRSFFKCVLEGLAVNLTNPKAILFFAAFLPSFVDLTKATLIDGIVLAMVIVFASVIDLFYVFTANSLRKRATSERSQQILSRLGGTTLISIGGLMMARKL